MNKTLKTFAAAVLLGSTALAPMAIAQTTAPTNPSAPAMDAPASQAPAATDTTKPAMPMAPAAGNTAAADGSYLTQQSESQISATPISARTSTMPLTKTSAALPT